MFCKECGSQVKDGARFCGSCGKVAPTNSENGGGATSPSPQFVNQTQAFKSELQGVKNWGKSEWLKFVSRPVVGLVVAFALLISTFLHWDSIASYGDAGTTFGWGVVILILSCVLIAAYAFEILTDPTSQVRFRIRFALVIINLVSLVGGFITVSEISSQNKFGGGISVGPGLTLSILCSVLGIASAAAQIFLSWSNGGASFGAAATARTSRNPQGPSNAPVASADEISKFADLRDRGIISEEEFQAQRDRLLGK